MDDENVDTLGRRGERVAHRDRASRDDKDDCGEWSRPRFGVIDAGLGSWLVMLVRQP